MTWLKFVNDTGEDVLVNSDHVYKIEPRGEHGSELFFTVIDLWGKEGRDAHVGYADTACVDGSLDTILTHLREGDTR